LVMLGSVRVTTAWEIPGASRATHSAVAWNGVRAWGKV
jgi:hypothetical protein